MTFPNCPVTHPAVTTIIPCFNAAGTLRRSVQSVRSQGVASRIVIVDDGSDPGQARDIARQVPEAGATVLHLPRRLGPGAARNAALDLCDTPYVAFLDADDVWLPGKLAAQLSRMEAQRLDFTYMRYANVRQGRARIMPVPTSVARGELLRNTAIGCSTVMVRRDFVGDRRFADARCEDLAFWAALLGPTGRAYLATDELMVLRHLGGRSRHKGRAPFRYWRTLRGTLGLSAAEASGHFLHYATRAMLKHRPRAAPVDIQDGLTSAQGPAAPVWHLHRPGLAQPADLARPGDPDGIALPRDLRQCPPKVAHPEGLSDDIGMQAHAHDRRPSL